jgi:titin
MNGPYDIRNIAEPGSRGRRQPWRRGFAGAVMTVALAGSPALAAAPAVAAPPAGSCPTPSVSAAAVANLPRIIFCLQADPGNAQVTLTWQPAIPDQLTNAFFVYDRAAGTGITTEVGAVTGDRVTVPDLTNGTAYSFWITRRASATITRVSSETVVSNRVRTVPATVPDAPTGLSASPDNGQVTLAWTAPAVTGGAPITGYHISWGSGQGSSMDIAAATRQTVPGLTNGTTYDFTVAAVNGMGTGLPSQAVRAVPVAVPDAPTGLTASPADGRVTLAWAAPAVTGGAPVIGYDLYLGTTLDPSASAPIARVTGTVVTVVGLANGTRYYFRVAAVSRIGPGPASDEAPAVPVTAPGAPTGLTATAADGRVTLAWTAPADDGGARVSGYLLYEGTSSGGESGPLVGGQPITATSYTVPSLTRGTAYYFTVVAVNSAGLSPASKEASVRLPTGSLVSPSPTTPSATTSSSAPPPTSSPTPSASSSTPSASSSTPSASSPTPSASSTPSPSTSPSTSNLPPTGLTATAGDGQATLSWTASASGPGGSPTAGYRIYEATGPGGLEAPLGTTSGTDAVVRPLSNGTMYYFTVAALTATGQESARSTEASARPQHQGPRVPVPQSVPKSLIALLAAAGAAIVATGFTLFTRSDRFRSRARHRQQAAVAADVRAVADTTQPDAARIRDTGPEPVHTIRFEPDPGVASTTIKERRP